MPKFKLKEDVLKVRGMDVKIRELTQKERNTFIEAATADRLSSPSVLMSLACVDPKFTVKEADEEPADVIEQVVDGIMRLSGLTKSKKDNSSNQPDARPALSVPSESGVGNTTQ
jgi:hypothetical protein